MKPNPKVFIVRKICRQLKPGDHVRATRLWNLIDHQSEPEPLWRIMQRLVPWAFLDPTDANSVIFAKGGDL